MPSYNNVTIAYGKAISVPPDDFGVIITLILFVALNQCDGILTTAVFKLFM